MQNLDLAMPASEHPCFALEAPTGCFIRFGELCSKFDKEPCKNHDQAKRAKLSQTCHLQTQPNPEHFQKDLKPHPLTDAQTISTKFSCKKKETRITTSTLQLGH